MKGLPRIWGATAEEVARWYPADGMVDGRVVHLTRAVSAPAPADIVYRWLCQLTLAPYSYDWLDNSGKKSPATLRAGSDELRVGRRLMGIFTLTDVRPARQFSALMTHGRGFFGEIALTYAAEPVDAEHTRIVCRVAAQDRPLFATLLAWGDLLMMRKQLRTLAAYAARDARALSRAR